MSGARTLIRNSLLAAATAVAISGCQSGGSSPSFFGSRGSSPGFAQSSPVPMFQGQPGAGPVIAQPNAANSPSFVGSPFSPANGGLASTPANTGGISGTFRRATTAVGNAFTIQPKVYPADDPLSLSGKSPKLGPELYVESAKLHESRGNIAGAVQQYQKALEMSPNHVPTLLGYARLHDRQSQFDEAVKLYRRAAQADPRSATALNDLGLCLARQGKYSESIEAINKAIVLQPDKKLYRNNLATVLVENGRYDEALTQLAAVHGPAVAHYNLADLLQQRNQPALAVEHFRKAAQLNPQFAEANAMLEKMGAGATSTFANFSGQVREFQERPLSSFMPQAAPQQTAPQPMQQMSLPQPAATTAPPADANSPTFNYPSTGYSIPPRDAASPANASSDNSYAPNSGSLLPPIQ